MYLAFVSLDIFTLYLMGDSFLKNHPENLLPFLLASIAISVGLASCSFSYSRVITNKLEKNTIVSSGELFFHSAIKLIIGLLIIYLLVYLSNFSIEKLSHSIGIVIRIIKGFVYLSSYSFIFDAIRSFHKGLYKIVKLHDRKINYDYGPE